MDFMHDLKNAIQTANTIDINLEVERLDAEIRAAITPAHKASLQRRLDALLEAAFSSRRNVNR